MLTLTRKVGEAIRIGDEITIIVKEIRKNQVRISIVAPREIKIYREEVYENILAERRAAQEGEDDASAEEEEAAAPKRKRGRRVRARRDKNSGGGGAPRDDEEAAG